MATIQQIPEVNLAPYAGLNFVQPATELWSTHGNAALLRFLDGKEDDRAPAYNQLSSLLSSQQTLRLALYLPFYILETASPAFKRRYLAAWKRLLSVADVRENFHIGDCFELDARPAGGPERVVKATHLTPWLLKSGVLTFDTLLGLLQEYRDNSLVLRGFSETWRFIEKQKILPWHEVLTLKKFTNRLPPRICPRPAYVSAARVKWLNEIAGDADWLATPEACLSGPFTPNLSPTWLHDLVATLASDQIVLIGGSRLKGYAVNSSDFDILDLAALTSSDSRNFLGDPSATHIYLNYAWLGGEDAKNIETLAAHARAVYRNDIANRHLHLEKLEQDLLQYRLLHKGYARYTGKITYDTSDYPELDDDCPFYDDDYRLIATKLFVKYVRIP